MEGALLKVCTKLNLPFGLKEEQKAIISSALNGHVLGILPTGFGKSECFGLYGPLLDEVNDIYINHIIMHCILLITLAFFSCEITTALLLIKKRK